MVKNSNRIAENTNVEMKKMVPTEVKSRTKRHWRFPLKSMVAVVAIAGVMYGLYKNPEFIDEFKETITAKQASEDNMRVSLEQMQQQILTLEQVLKEVVYKAEHPDLTTINGRIDDLEQIHLNTIKSKADIDVVLGLISRMDTAEGKIGDFGKVTNDSALVLTAAMLVKEAGERGGTFVYEAEVLSELAAGNYKIDKEVKRLSEIAAIGVPTVGQIQEKFAEIYAKKYPETPEEDLGPAKDWKERIYHQLHKVVRVNKTDVKIEKQHNFSEEDRAWQVISDMIVEGDIARAVAIAEKPLNAVLHEDKMFVEWFENAKIYRDFYADINRISANSLAVMKVKFLQNQN